MSRRYPAAMVVSRCNGIRSGRSQSPLRHRIGSSPQERAMPPNGDTPGDETTGSTAPSSISEKMRGSRSPGSRGSPPPRAPTSAPAPRGAPEPASSPWSRPTWTWRPCLRSERTELIAVVVLPSASTETWVPPPVISRTAPLTLSTAVTSMVASAPKIGGQVEGGLFMSTAITWPRAPPHHHRRQPEPPRTREPPATHRSTRPRSATALTRSQNGSRAPPHRRGRIHRGVR